MFYTVSILKILIQIFFYPVQISMRKAIDDYKMELNNEKITEFRWCTRDEGGEFKFDRKYLKAFQTALIE